MAESALPARRTNMPRPATGTMRRPGSDRHRP